MKTLPSTPWSNGSANCRLEWRPSRWAVGACIALGALAALSISLSAIPAVVAWPLGLLLLVEGVRLGRRERRKPRREFVFPGDGGPVLVDGLAAHDLQVHWRGPLAFVHWRWPGGRMQRLAWWPDTLPPRARRELRLAAALGSASLRAA